MWLKNHSKNTRYYSIFQLSPILLLNNNQYNCNSTNSSVSVVTHILDHNCCLCMEPDMSIHMNIYTSCRSIISNIWYDPILEKALCTHY